jgi:mannose-6-phosphate isomerase-like protein (cupin superfamily)
MKLPLLLAVLTVTLATAALADETKPTGVVVIDHEKVSAALAKGGLLIETNNFKVQGGHRVAPGAVEIHEKDTDIFYVLEGSATFVTGGKTVEPKATTPGEIRGKEIVGGEEHHLTKGDVIVIPNGVPHWFKEVNGSFVYYVVKVSK